MFRTHLVARMREINEEVAHYPRPIARCDVQLSKLLEERARLFQQMDRAAGVDSTRSGASARWLQHLNEYLANLKPCGDDAIETDLRRRLMNSLSNGRS